MSVRASYVEHFGEQEAVALEAAASKHKNRVHDNRGTDPFKWAVVIAIGYQCVEKYSESHGITVPWGAFHLWAKNHAELTTHDGDCDYITLFIGGYNEYVQAEDE